MMRDTPPTRVLLVDDHPIVRRGLRELLEDEPDFEVCAEAGALAEALWAEDHHRPDLLIVDVALDGRDGLELTRQIHSDGRSVPVLILTMHDERLYGGRAYRAGARGYVMKNAPDAEILAAARAVAAGDTYFSEVVWQQLEQADSEAPMASLTDRELQVLTLLGQGLAPREIADQLTLSVSTIENYRERLKKKLGLDSARTLQRYAVRWVHDRSTR